MKKGAWEAMSQRKDIVFPWHLFLLWNNQILFLFPHLFHLPANKENRDYKSNRIGNRG